MSSSTSEERKNPVVTLKAQAEKFDFSKLRAGKNNTGANSGYQTYLDIKRMNFVINKKSIDSALTTALIKGAEQNEVEKSWSEHCKEEKTPDDKKTDQYKKKFEEFYNLGTKYTNLLPKEKAGNYRPFAKEVFKEMFKYAKAEVPSDPILEELVTNCNQAGYEFIYAPFMSEFSSEHALHMDVNSSNVNRRVLINRKKNSDSVSVECSTSAIPVKVPGGKNRATCDISFSVGFTLNPQGDKSVTYKDGKLSLTVPERLKDYNIGDKSLFDIIKECFQKLCEKLGFFKIKIECGLGNPLEVNSHLEGVQPPIHSNEHKNTP